MRDEGDQRSRFDGKDIVIQKSDVTRLSRLEEIPPCPRESESMTLTRLMQRIPRQPHITNVGASTEPRYRFSRVIVGGIIEHCISRRILQVCLYSIGLLVDHPWRVKRHSNEVHDFRIGKRRG